MLVPQAFLAALCVGLGLFPGVVLRALDGVMASLPGLQPRSSHGAGRARHVVGARVVRSRRARRASASRLLGGLVVAAMAHARDAGWPCGGCRRGDAAAS